MDSLPAELLNKILKYASNYKEQRLVCVKFNRLFVVVLALFFFCSSNLCFKIQQLVVVGTVSEACFFFFLVEFLSNFLVQRCYIVSVEDRESVEALIKSCTV